MTEVSAFAQWFARVRPAVGSQAAVAQALGITERALRAWEKGASVPEPHRAEAIAEVLDHPADEVMEMVLSASRQRAEQRAEKLSRRAEEKRAAAAEAARAWAETKGPAS